MVDETPSKFSGPKNGEPVRYLNTAEAAAYLGLSAKTLEKMRITGGGPPYRKHGRFVRYTIAELDHWSRRRTQRSTADDHPRTNHRRWRKWPERRTPIGARSRIGTRSRPRKTRRRRRGLAADRR